MSADKIPFESDLLLANTFVIQFEPKVSTGRSDIPAVQGLSGWRRCAPDLGGPPINLKGPVPPLHKFHSHPSSCSGLLCQPSRRLIHPHHSDQKHQLSAHSPTVVARCTDLITTGRLWDVYRAEITLTDRPSEKFDAILKITVPTLLPPQVPAVSEYYPLGMAELVQHTSETGEKAAWNEDYMFRNHLMRYQGNLIPKYYGTFVCYIPDEPDHPYAIAQTQELVGPQLQPSGAPIQNLPREILLNIHARYKDLNKEGHVVHRSVHRNHILVRETFLDGSKALVLVDFQLSVPLKKRAISISKTQWKSQNDRKLLAQESEDVSFMTVCKFFKGKWWFVDGHD